MTRKFLSMIFRNGLFLICFVCTISMLTAPSAVAAARKVGVIYVVHGGSASSSASSLWESAIQIFSYDPNNPIYQRVIWNSEAWPSVVKFGDDQRYSNVKSQIRKYAFENERLGGLDPARTIVQSRFEQMTAELERLGVEKDIEFITDWASWITSRKDVAHYPRPRSLYFSQVPGGSNLTYCGSENDGGILPDFTWPDCDPERYNIDGPAERLAKAGVEEIIIIDTTTTGVRFVKSFEVVEKSREAIHEFNEENGTKIQVHWVNDPADLMMNSHPTKPEGWTRTLEYPEVDPKVPLDGKPNPVTDDPALAPIMVDGIVSRFSPNTPPEKTGVFIINHSVSRHNETFDPKVNDTLVLNDNIKQELLARELNLDPENIIGGWMGVKQPNSNVAIGGRITSNIERTRLMRGENLGHAYLYETDKVIPTGEWGYRYWDGFEFLKDRGVEHIVIIFSQIVTDSVLNLVELPNQVAKEIGYKTWAFYDVGDYETYPKVGHPFADYWGVWADTQCKRINQEETGMTEACCFQMGGCGGTQPYPPQRQAPLDALMGDLDPSLVFDVSAYGDLGYDPDLGPPNDNAPVQDQYSGTWALWDAPNDDPRLAKYLADKVIEFIDSR